MLLPVCATRAVSLPPPCLVPQCMSILPPCPPPCNAALCAGHTPCATPKQHLEFQASLTDADASSHKT
eukprot:363083-Chlamydomonas_euryale.AAC.11